MQFFIDVLNLFKMVINDQTVDIVVRSKGKGKRDDRKDKTTKENESAHNIFQHKQCQSHVYVLAGWFT